MVDVRYHSLGLSPYQSLEPVSSGVRQALFCYLVLPFLILVLPDLCLLFYDLYRLFYLSISELIGSCSAK